MNKITVWKTVMVAVIFGAGVSAHSAYGQSAGGQLPCLRASDAAAQDQSLYDLLYRLSPTVFINANDVVTYGTDSFALVECVVSQLPQLYAVNPFFTDAKVIKFKIGSPLDVVSLDLDLLQSFTQLEYVWLVYEYDACGGEADSCLQAMAEKSVTQSSNSKVTVLYELAIPR